MTTLNPDRIAHLLDQDARLLEQLAQVRRQLATEFRPDNSNETDTGLGPILPPKLGSLQQSVFDVLRSAGEGDFSPREIAKRLDRGDEPNVRSALDRLQQRNVAELVPGSVTQRWRLTTAYR